MSLEQEYEERHGGALIPIAAALEGYLKDCTTGVDRIDRISARAKSVSRFLAKAAKKKKDGSPKYADPLQDIQDQIGARIITFYKNDVTYVENAVSKYFRAVEQRQLIPESVNEFSYVGRHFILFLPSDVTNCYDRRLVPKFFELQIKTLFQHAWAEANHDIAYKPPVPMNAQQKRLIAFTAAQAWGADQVFDQLYEELVNVPRITCETIEKYCGTLKLDLTCLKCDMWCLFNKEAYDSNANAQIVSLKRIISTKDERLDEKFLAGLKGDPRQVALGHMEKAAAKLCQPRNPITVTKHSDGFFYVVDGNATVQVLMLAQWEMVPVIVVEPSDT